MKQIIKDLIKEIKTAIINDMNGGRNKEVIMLVLKAYNRFQEDEKDGADYIFDINNPNDLICCIRGGMTCKQISDLYAESQTKTTMFYFGVNYEQPLVIKDTYSLACNLVSYLAEMLPFVLAHHEVDGYKQLFDKYVSDFIINNNYNFL